MVSEIIFYIDLLSPTVNEKDLKLPLVKVNLKRISVRNLHLNEELPGTALRRVAILAKCT